MAPSTCIAAHPLFWFTELGMAPVRYPLLPCALSLARPMCTAGCWEQVVPLLQAKGHTVIALDLPGLGEDTRPTPGITLQDNIATVVGALKSLGSPALLVGHSLGGVTVGAGRYPSHCACTHRP